MNLAPIRNRSVTEQLGRGYRYYSTTRGHCDCGTALGALASLEPSGASDRRLQRQLRERRKMGWSNAKIKRWLADKADSERAREDSRKRSLADELGRWEKLLQAVLKTAATEVGLLVCDYSGLQSDDLDLKKPTRSPLSAVNRDFLATLQRDRAHLVRLQ